MKLGQFGVTTVLTVAGVLTQTWGKLAASTPSLTEPSSSELLPSELLSSESLTDNMPTLVDLSSVNESPVNEPPVNGSQPLDLQLLTSQASTSVRLSTTEISADPSTLFSQSSALDPIAQVTSVSQLSDVQPTDWAYEALRSLVERYGCINGYANNLYRGGRSLTRYEFAAALNTCLDRVNELINQDLAQQFSAADLATLQRLQDEFTDDLATVRSRIDILEGPIAELEANQFSTTTQLRGQTILSFNGGIQGDADDPNSVLLSRVRLNLVTSFTGSDQLVTQLQTGTSSSDRDAANFLLRDETTFRDDLVVSGNEITDLALNRIGLDLNTSPQLRLSNQDSFEEIRDRFATNLQSIAIRAGASPAEAQEIFETAIESAEIAQGVNGFLRTNSALDYSDANTSVRLNQLSYGFSPNSDLTVALFAQGFASDYVDRNPYANNSGENFSTYGLVNNQLLLANDPPGAGAAVQWNPNEGFLTLRAVYRAEQAALTSASPNDGNQGGLFGDPYLGIVELEVALFDDAAIALQYSGGAQGDTRYDVVGANVQVRLNKQFNLFGRFGYAFNFPGELQPSAWSVGVTLPDLFIPGAVGGVAIGQPLIFEEDVLGLFDRTQTNYEIFYKLPINDNISVTPAIQFITDPGNRSNDAILTGTLRVVFNLGSPY